MRSVTDTFIKHPVLAVVVNLVIVLVGWRAITSLPVQQYPKIESSSVLITTVYYGASAEADTPNPEEAYARFDRPQPERPDYWDALPWA